LGTQFITRPISLRFVTAWSASRSRAGCVIGARHNNHGINRSLDELVVCHQANRRRVDHRVIEEACEDLRGKLPARRIQQVDGIGQVGPPWEYIEIWVGIQLHNRIPHGATTAQDVRQPGGRVNPSIWANFDF